MTITGAGVVAVRATILVGLLGVSGTAAAETRPKVADADKIPITTTSDDARALYVKGRDLSEKLRATDAHALFAQAVAKDKEFASGYLGLATTSGTTKDFFEALDQAVAHMGKASPGEQLLIAAAAAGGKGDLVHQKEALDKLVKAFPGDERVQNQLGIYYFNRQDYAESIVAFEKAIHINAAFSQPYNQLGYAYRFTDRLPEAEKAFTRYIELIPDDPNPYDSYAELLMKEGKFDESIKSYQKALSLDPNFVASYIGIGNDQIFQGHGDEARKTFAKLAKTARTDGERRQALFWTSMTYAYEGAWDKAIAEVDKEAAVAIAAHDLGNLANDYNLIANYLLEAGRPDDAAAKFKTQLETSEKAEVPAEVKETTRRLMIYADARIALAKHDLATAKAKATAYGKQVAVKQKPLEVLQSHELLGEIAIADHNFKVAVTELASANRQDPRVLYLSAVALQGAGDMKSAKAMATKVAEFNGLAVTYAYVRSKAKALQQ